MPLENYAGVLVYSKRRSKCYAVVLTIVRMSKYID